MAYHRGREQTMLDAKSHVMILAVVSHMGVFTAKEGLPALSEEDAVVDRADGVTKTDEFVSGDCPELLDGGNLKGGHNSGQMPASACYIGKSWLKDGALDDGAAEERTRRIRSGQHVTNYISTARASTK
jgi:hypothetical protein